KATATVSVDDIEDEGSPGDSKRGGSDYVVQAALTALLYSSRPAAAAIIRHAPLARPSAYDYGERYGPSRAWAPILRVCIRAWSAGKPVAYHDLLPGEVKITRQ